MIEKQDFEIVSDEDTTLALPDQEEGEPDGYDTSTLTGYLMDQFHRAEDARRSDEDRMLRAYRNYRGLWMEGDQFTKTEKSRVFIRVTKTKVLAAYGQIIEVLFGGQKFPLAVEPTPEPEGAPESVHFDPENQTEEEEADASDPYGFPGDGRDIPPGATQRTLLERIGDLGRKFVGLEEKLKEGQGLTGTSHTYHPAEAAARRMEKRIHDQLEESNGSKHLRVAAFEMPLFGTGILKGPFAEDKEYPRWQGGMYVPTIKTVPRMSAVSVWSFYPDPDACNMEEAEYIFERHKMSRAGLRKLKKRPFFRGEVIDEVISDGPNYVKKWWEDSLNDNDHTSVVDRFEVLEYWGNVDAALAEDAGLEIPEEFEDVETLQINAWLCDGKILRLVINPFQPKRIPYYAAPYEVNPYSMFGIGLAENMEDTQTLMNGFMRLAIDNAVLSGNIILEIDETNMVPGQSMEVYPGKIFRRQGGAPGQAIFATQYPNVAQQNIMMFDKARQLADEATGIPSFSHGQTGVTGVGRTAAGISMLMGAAQVSIKTVVKNIDDYLLQPLGESFFSFNMQFGGDPSVEGDLEIKARGTESLMRNEVRSQRLIQLLQLAANPAVAPFIKMGELVRQICYTMDLNADRLVNDEREAARQAMILANTMGGQGQQQQQEAPEELDMTGGGQGIGVGGAALPGEPQFAGNGMNQIMQALESTVPPQAAAGASIR